MFCLDTKRLNERVKDYNPNWTSPYRRFGHSIFFGGGEGEGSGVLQSKERGSEDIFVD